MSVIKSNEHVSIIGGTGTGKTVLAVVMLANRDNHIVVLDTKGKFSFLGMVPDEDITYFYTLKDLVSSDIKTKKAIYRPNINELDYVYYDKFFEWCYNRGNNIVVVDEAAQVCKNAHSYPKSYKDILQRGRELNVGIWSLTQRPSNIAPDIIAQSLHFYIFRLNNINDRKKVSNSAGQDLFLKKVTGYNFLYWRADTDKKPVLRVLDIKRV